MILITPHFALRYQNKVIKVNYNSINFCLNRNIDVYGCTENETTFCFSLSKKYNGDLKGTTTTTNCSHCNKTVFSNSNKGEKILKKEKERSGKKVSKQRTLEKQCQAPDVK